MTGRTAFAPGFLRFLLRPPVGRPFFVCSLAAFAGDLTLPAWLHYSEAASTFDHDASLDRQQDGTLMRVAVSCCRRSRSVQLICLAPRPSYEDAADGSS